MTLRHGAEGHIDLGELGHVTVRATSHNGEIDVTIRADHEDAVAMLQTTSALLEGELRRESLEIRHLGVERERRTRTDEDGARRERERQAPRQDEAAPEAEQGFESDLERSVRIVLSPPLPSPRPDGAPDPCHPSMESRPPTAT
ncbi:MAG: flagellar hook-length control protein FliK [Deltaproteobacteria bacterium]|nr:flagellar hook-length control protein FliK [Deltaproteobacteria bacterium]